ncbi:kynureninase [Colwelliaceae bacterium 6471]
MTTHIDNNTKDSSIDAFDNSLNYAQQLDANDPLAPMRSHFAIPKQANGEDEYYFTGNSLGLQPKLAREYVIEMLDAWQERGVKGHFEGEFPWMPYHEFLTEQSAKLVGALPQEVVMMNSLTANLHFMMVSFYQPQGKRTKILIEDHAFPSDHYAVESQLKHHQGQLNGSVADNMLLWKPRAGEELLNYDDLDAMLEQYGDEIALILLPGVQYYTGQVLDMKSITAKAHAKGITVGFDLAHAAGNILLQLHDWQVDFACWCSYKYLNSGAGSVAGCFVHQKHCENTELTRFAGWWGHDKSTRFQMGNEFKAIASAEGWQLSNPPVLSLAAIRGSLDTIDIAGGITALREKSLKLTDYLLQLITHELGDKIRIITPVNAQERGCQLSLMINVEGLDGKAMFNALEENGVTTDWREPNVIRVAPVPLYNQFQDAYHFVRILKDCLA